MVDIKNVQKQLKRIKFGASMWNQAEMRELPNILHEDENIAECTNGIYENGFALLVATDMRLLLIDKKPLNYLNVEDLRFDMINEIDYSHRLMGATITISTGSKTLKFKSYNQPRLRRLIGQVQERMSEIKKEAAEKTENQQQHLEEINKQLQMYLMAQHQQLQQQIAAEPAPVAEGAVPKPDPQLADYLFAQRLLEKFQQQNGTLPAAPAPASPTPVSGYKSDTVSSDDLLAEGQREVFGKAAPSSQVPPTAQPVAAPTSDTSATAPPKSLEINALKIAYSKLPMMLRNRKFGRPSFHAHSEQASAANQTQPAA